MADFLWAWDVDIVSNLTYLDEKEWMNKWMNGWMNEWMNGWMNEWMKEWKNDLMKEWLNKWTQAVRLLEYFTWSLSNIGCLISAVGPSQAILTSGLRSKLMTSSWNCISWEMLKRRGKSRCWGGFCLTPISLSPLLQLQRPLTPSHFWGKLRWVGQRERKWSQFHQHRLVLGGEESIIGAPAAVFAAGPAAAGRIVHIES